MNELDNLKPEVREAVDYVPAAGRWGVCVMDDPAFDAARRDPWFWVCVHEALDTPGFAEEWHRLRGYPAPRNLMDRMVDEACGLNESKARQFVRDIYDTVYTRIPRPQAQA